MEELLRHTLFRISQTTQRVTALTSFISIVSFKEIQASINHKSSSESQ